MAKAEKSKKAEKAEKTRPTGPRVEVVIGHVVDALRKLPDRSVHAVVTSPPYWGLRDYGTEPIIFGGDPGCEHDWGTLERGKRKDMLPADVTTSKGRSGTTPRQDGAAHDGGRHCRRCDAWSGSLGKEPTPEAWCANQVEVFKEVWRVLRDDGVAFVNVGDSYACGPPGNEPNTSKDSSGFNNSRENLEMRRSGYGRRKFRAQKRGSKQETNKGSDRDGCPVVVGWKPGDRICQAYMLAEALRRWGWTLRQIVVWAKGISYCEGWSGAVMPESVEGWSWQRHRIRIEKRKPGTKRLGATPPSTHHPGQVPHRDGSFNDKEDLTKWTDCPGCDKCKDNDGLVLRRGSWRPTNSYELVLMLSKGMGYYSDQEAVKERSSRTKSGNKRRWRRGADRQGSGRSSRGEGVPWEGTTRNPRSVFCIRTGQYPESHFAVYPVQLILPMIRASTSEKGVCRRCGAPWARVIEVAPGTPMPASGWDVGPGAHGTPATGGSECRDEYRGKNRRRGKSDQARALLRHAKEARAAGADHGNWHKRRKTLGWRPTCGHKGRPVPATVLDPYIGSGTTAEACILLGRACIGIDLDATNGPLIDERIRSARHEVRYGKGYSKVKKLAAQGYVQEMLF